MATDCFRVLFQPSFCRLDLTILLFIPILWTNKLRLKRNHKVLFVVNDHRREDTVKIFCLSIGAFPMRAVLTMDLLGTKVFRPIDGDPKSLFSIAILIQQPACFYFTKPFPCLPNAAGSTPSRSVRIWLSSVSFGSKTNSDIWRPSQQVDCALVFQKEADWVKKTENAAMPASAMSYCRFCPLR